MRNRSLRRREIMQGNTIRIVIKETKGGRRKREAFLQTYIKGKRGTTSICPTDFPRPFMHNAKNFYHEIRSLLYIQNLGLYWEKIFSNRDVWSFTHKRSQTIGFLGLSHIQNCLENLFSPQQWVPSPEAKSIVLTLAHLFSHTRNGSLFKTHQNMSSTLVPLINSSSLHGLLSAVNHSAKPDHPPAKSVVAVPQGLSFTSLSHR